MGHARQLFRGSSILALVGAAALSVATLSPARAAAPPVPVTVQAGALDRALMTLAAQTGVRILFENALVAGRTAPPLQGVYTARQALEQLLSGSDIEIVEARPGVLVLRARRTPIAASSAPSDAPSGAVSGAPSSLSAGLDAQASQSPASADRDPVVVSEIVVGSNIRGAGHGASPVLILDRGDIDRAGYSSVAEALAALPQAFGGLASEDASTTGADPSGTNVSEASGVNLRGLGADATLVLVNGRRLAGTGSKGDFADVSSIPLVAVERIEVLLDGASALYGSDAVGGVVNIVLRSHFEGAETRASGGLATQGGYHRQQFAQAAGHAWRTGDALIAYEFQGHSALRGRERDFTGEADLRPFGGSDRRLFYSRPGNVLGASLTPAFAIPAAQSGQPLKAGDFLAGQTNLENQRAYYDVLGRQRRHSLYATVRQDIGDIASLSADARLSQRKFHLRGSASLAALTIDRNNPWFVSPGGAASDRIAYSFGPELGPKITDGLAESLAFSAGGDVKLPAGWRADLYGAYAQERGETRLSNAVNSAYLSEALGGPDNPATAFSTATSGFFNPYLAAGSNPRPILDFIGGGYERRKTRGETASVNLKADGALFDLPGGAVRMALGGQLRRETLKTGGESFISAATATPITRRDVARDIESVFAELNAPLFGPANARPGLRRLELSLAGRYEHYEGVGSSSDPKVGLVWGPSQDLTVKATYGTSFRAPSLPELNDPYVIAPTMLPGPGGGSLLTLILVGGNPDLKPETATSWTTGLDFTPARWPGLKLNATLFETRFKDRIGQPAIDNLLTVLSAPELASFRSFVSPNTSTADRARVQALLDDPATLFAGLFDVTAYRAIADARNVNTGQVRVRGLDLSGSYQTRLAGAPLSLQGNLSWLMNYDRKVTPTSRAVALAGVAGYPADLRARISATWTRGSLAYTAALNHVGDSHDEAGHRLKSWTTGDLQVRWEPTNAGGPWRNLSLSLTVQNLLDTDPPFYDSPLAVGYDPANADPIGRLVAVQLSKRW